MRLELDAVLADPAFARSPVQAKLLRYLVERAIAGDGPPTQFEIAVDALGKSPDFDLVSDSYPRVQISRLRHNLDHYYLRNRPVGEGRLRIDTGGYAIRLAPFDDPPSDRPAEAEPAAPSGAPADGRIGFARLPTPARRIAAFAGLIALVLGAGLLAAAVFVEGSQSEATARTDAPIIALEPDLRGLDNAPGEWRALAGQAVRQAEMMLAFSRAARVSPQAGRGEADYVLDLRFESGPRGGLQAFVVLSDRNDTVLLRETVGPELEDPQIFTAGIAWAISKAIAPGGRITRIENQRIDDPLASDYACFVRLEALRGQNRSDTALLDACIERHPTGEYTPFLLARRALRAYQTDVIEGRAVVPSGRAWQDVKAALSIDPENPYANFVCAKVAIAQGNCDAAGSNLRIAADQSIGHPTLLAAVASEARSCPDPPEGTGLSPGELRAMIAATPAPSAPHHLNMLMAALASGELDAARMLLVRPIPGQSNTHDIHAIKLLRRAMTDPSFLDANEQRIRQELGLFNWGGGAVDRLIENLRACTVSQCSRQAQARGS
ncbi:hypothetical protein [Erythrobacter sp.]|uniref:hypothetical protein n=1 Tax=Erythrobacter sp. TaxID=1042 RepID=UPI0025C2EC37|nr:hypothetical protein [Erythrobacter sp.]